MNQKQESKLTTIYKDAKKRAQKHLTSLQTAQSNEVIDSDRIMQYLQETIDCLKICIDGLDEGSETKRQYARYKDELGDLGEEIIKLTKPNRW